MNTALKTASTTEVARGSATRIASIDVFRGLTMAVMIFVNALDGVRGLPWWTHHAPARVDVMTYVDMVFPFFLFAVGLSLPLAVERRLRRLRRLRRDGSEAGLWAHVALRSASLVVLGLILANAEKADRARMGMSGNVWGLLGLVCAALFLLDYGSWERLRPYAYIFQGIGLAGVAILYGVFRRTTPGGQAAWIDFSYPEILGLIGFSYFAVAILYIPTRHLRWAPAAWFVLLVALCALANARMVMFPERLPLYVWPFGNGAMCCIVMAGVVTSSFFRGVDGDSPPHGRRPVAWASGSAPRKGIGAAVAFGVAALAAGWALKPLGISKIRATPTWSLWSVGAAALLFALLYWICDVRQWRRWALPVRPAGSNTLTTYLLPDVWDLLLGSLGLVFWDAHFAAGWPGVVKTIVFTCMILALAGVLTRAKVRLQL